MFEFLENLSALLIFYGLAILASLVLVIQIGLAMFGFDDIDAGDIDAGEGLGFLSVRSLVGFFGGFGWTGVLMLENGTSLAAATAAGIGVGLMFMLLIASVMKFLYAFGESGTLDFRNAVGQVGTVYLTVPARRGGPGQVRVIVQGRLKVVQAFTESPTPLPAQSKIKVSGLIDSRTLLVDPLGDTKEES